MRQRAELGQSPPTDALEAIEPERRRIDLLRAEIERCDELLRDEQLRAPVAGNVLTRSRLAGDRAEDGRPVVALLEQGTLCVTLFVRHGDFQAFAVGETVTVDIPSLAQGVACRVVAVGRQCRHAPPCIARRYRADEPLLPVKVKFTAGIDDELAPPLGSVAALPRP